MSISQIGLGKKRVEDTAVPVPGPYDREAPLHQEPYHMGQKPLKQYRMRIKGEGMLSGLARHCLDESLDVRRRSTPVRAAYADQIIVGDIPGFHPRVHSSPDGTSNLFGIT
jgi:hypothetical protein